MRHALRFSIWWQISAPSVGASGVDPIHISTRAGIWIHDVPAGMNPLLHYVLLGEVRGLPPSRHFDPAWYRQRYSVGSTDSPLAHYLKHRRTQLFSPLPAFDVAAYIQTHATKLRPDRDPYAYFLAIGRFVQTRTDQTGRFAA
jgi:hypothetical protein